MVSTEKPSKVTTEWILASGSKYRRKQLADRGLSVRCLSPDIDESPIEGEIPLDRAIRLAREKSVTVSQRLTGNTVVIAGDQVSHQAGFLLRKPGNYQNALQQLTRSSGQWVTFESAFAVTATIGGQVTESFGSVRTEIRFRQMSPSVIERYLRTEQPFDSAGSFYSEAIGGWLIEEWRTSDPSALVGLPTIALGQALRELGLDPLEAVANA